MKMKNKTMLTFALIDPAFAKLVTSDVCLNVSDSEVYINLSRTAWDDSRISSAVRRRF